MNILSHIHIHRVPRPSGVGRVIDRMLEAHRQAFPETRHRMLVAAPQYNRVYQELNDRWKAASHIPHARGISLQQAIWVWRHLPSAEMYWKDVDIVYCPAESYVPVEQAALVCTIHDVAGFEETLYPNTMNKKWHCAKWNILFHAMARRADAVVTVSRFSAERIAHFFPCLEDKLRVVPNAPHALFRGKASAEAVDTVKQRFGRQPYILVPGGLSLRKNANLILDALPLLAEKWPDVHVVVAGRNDAPYVKSLKPGLFPNLVCAGYVSDDQLNALYKMAAAVWFPSRYEGFGMPVLEAMAAGSPVVAGRASSIPEVAGDAALLCDVNDPGEHVDALGSFLASEAVRTDLIQRGFKQTESFTWTASARKLNGIFENVLRK